MDEDHDGDLADEISVARPDALRAVVNTMVNLSGALRAVVNTRFR